MLKPERVFSVDFKLIQNGDFALKLRFGKILLFEKPARDAESVDYVAKFRR
jgi:hypothetical protein